jgi:nicotinamidase/pyrazinamidase
MEMRPTDGLIVVDIQRDFCPGGALPVPQGDTIIDVVNRIIQVAEQSQSTIVYTRDWHPENHLSFKEFGGIWPPHCVQWTPGAEFHPSLYLSEKGIIVSKGTHPEFEAYSGFQGTQLHEILQSRKINRLFIVGLATDYCVKETALDALRYKYETYVVEDAVRGVNVHPEDSEKALQTIMENGGKIIRSEELL